MADKISLTMQGGEDLMRKLRSMGINVAHILEVATVAGAVVLEETAKPLAPGPEIIHDVVERNAQQISVDVGPDKTKWYYTFFETGAGPHDIEIRGRIVKHPGMAAKPFLRPAFDEADDDAVDAVGDVLRGPIMEECIG